jgi:hypothetical protein
MRVCAKMTSGTFTDLLLLNCLSRPNECIRGDCRGKNIYQHPRTKGNQKKNQNMSISLGWKREETFIARDAVRLSAHCERSGYGDNQYPVGTLWRNQDRHACVPFVGGSWRSW